MVKAFCTASAGRDEDSLVITYHRLDVTRPEDLSVETIADIKRRAVAWLRDNYSRGTVYVEVCYLDENGSIDLGMWRWTRSGNMID